VADLTFVLRDDHIALGQLLKALDVVGSGGEAKMYLQENKVTLNGAPTQERGRKVRPGDTVVLPDGRSVQVVA
jgi:ribosome-associated protein YbcJ (S4-like RNA binding protein)